jgi:hypothetical protein
MGCLDYNINNLPFFGLFFSFGIIWATIVIYLGVETYSIASLGITFAIMNVCSLYLLNILNEPKK